MFEHSDGCMLWVVGHMAQMGKKNLTLFQALQKEKAAKARAARSTEVPNLQESLVDVHVHDGTKRKAKLPAKQRKGREEGATRLDGARIVKWRKGTEGWID